MSDGDGLDGFEAQIDALDSSLGSAASVAAGFDSELGKMRSSLGATGRDLNGLSSGFSRGLRNAFDGVAFGGDKLSDALSGLATSMVNTAYSAAAKTEGGGSGVSVVMNISTPDAESFRRSSSQISAQMSRALSRGQRNR